MSQDVLSIKEVESAFLLVRDGLRTEVGLGLAALPEGAGPELTQAVVDAATVAQIEAAVKRLRQLAADKAALGPEVIKAARRGETLS
jgi:hypothetical protein